LRASVDFVDFTEVSNAGGSIDLGASARRSSLAVNRALRTTPS
jgi:hypothetical protein